MSIAFAKDEAGTITEAYSPLWTDEKSKLTTWFVLFTQDGIVASWGVTTSMPELFTWEDHWHNVEEKRSLSVFKIISEGPINVISQTEESHIREELG